MTQICKKFGLMKPSMWKILHKSPIHDNFKTWRQLHTLIIGELSDLRNNKGSRDLTAMSLEILVSGVKHNVSNLGFSLCISDSLAKVRDTARSLLHRTHSSHLLLRQP